MDFLTVLQVLLRFFSLLLAVVLAVLYIAFHVFQKMPLQPFRVRVYDGVTWGIVAFLFALGLNSYWGFIAFVPLVAWKFLSRHAITKERVEGSGRWFELRWQKFTPKGFTNMPRSTWDQVSREIQRLPGDTHLILPRFVALWAIKFMLKKSKKDKAKVAAQLRGREDEAFQRIDEMASSIFTLAQGKTERFSLVFGVLRITRL